MRDQYLERCDFVKTVLMLFVILGHSCAFWNGTWFSAQSPAINDFVMGCVADWFGTFHVYGFTLISGYIYSYIREERGGYESVSTFIKNKAKRLLLPYLFVSVIWVIPVSNYFYHYDMNDIIEKFILGTSPSQLWFLLMLFDVFLIFRLTDSLKIKRSIFFIIVICLYAVGAVGQMAIFNPFQVFTALYFFPFFVIGVYLRENTKHYLITNNGLLAKPKYLFVLFVGNIIFYLLYIYMHAFNETYMKISSRLLYLFLNFEGAITSFAILLYLAGKLDYQQSPIYKQLAQNNFAMYLFHQQIIYIVITMLNGVILPAMHALINMLLSVVISFVIALLFRHFRLTRILIGEK